MHDAIISRDCVSERCRLTSENLESLCLEFMECINLADSQCLKNTKFLENMSTVVNLNFSHCYNLVFCAADFKKLKKLQKLSLQSIVPFYVSFFSEITLKLKVVVRQTL